MFKSILSSTILILLIQAPLQAAITGEDVNYKSGNTNLIGYIAYDNAVKGKRPGVILAPDWWGISEFARSRARALAKLGYTAMVMDMVGAGMFAETTNKAKALMGNATADPKVMKARFLAAKNVLSKHESTNGKIAAMGYSLGGMIVLEMARQGVDLKSVVSIWGVISKADKPAKKGKVKARVLIIHPATDGWAPKEAVDALKIEMANARANFQIITYPNTKHGFTRPDADTKAEKDNLPLKYDAAADKKSWNDLGRFLKASFK